jgi:hypothetical protein
MVQVFTIFNNRVVSKGYVYVMVMNKGKTFEEGKKKEKKRWGLANGTKLIVRWKKKIGG